MPEDCVEKALPVSSSKPPEFSAKQLQLFRGVLRLLNEHRVPYVVSGAFALHAHSGIWRNTKDMDVFLAPEQLLRALQQLRRAGIECDVPDPVWLAKAHGDGYFVDLITGMSNGALTVDASWIERSHPEKVLGVAARMLAPEELIASKLFVTRRERFDGADICHVIYGTRGQIDWQRLLALVAEHWEMLLWAVVLFRYVYPAQTSYVPRDLWDDLLARFGQAVRSPAPGASFRGSLIDPMMFAIDVEEWGLPDLQAELRKRRHNPELEEGWQRRAASRTPAA